MPPLRTGWLRSRVTIQSRTATGDGQGGSSFAWAPTRTIWAHVAPATPAGDTTEADQTVSRREYLVTIRRNTTVTAAMRVVRGAQTLDILSVLADDTKPDATVLLCREVTT